MAVTCCDAPGLMPVEQAMTQMLESIVEKQGSTLVPLADALDCILAADVVSPINVPVFDNSAMDGYAFPAQDLASFSTLTRVGRVYAGESFTGELKPGECVRIMTGAPMPAGADTVQMQENVTVVDDEHIKLDAVPKMGANVRYAGEDIKQGAVVLQAGERLKPAHLGLLASLGVAEVEIKQPIKVGVFSTGDELVPVGQPLAAGQIYDSNRFFLVALLKRLNVDVIDYGCLVDDIEILRNTLLTAADEVDALITSGGVSVGEADFTKDVLDEIGNVNFWKLAIKPGKPFAFGKIPSIAQNKDILFFGLPGNPVSSFVTCHQLVVPALQTLMGAKKQQKITLTAKSQSTLKKRPGRMDFQRAVYSVSDTGELVVLSTGAQGSGILTSICQANCYILLAQQQGNVVAGEQVEILPFDQFIS
ncbi:molybdopterin molybdenumtransferase MoeA [Saccharobesus litoralis]|uniref:Molybdopterin molybdenumtransferase n=1 Tax=Saccharobesus litoralis TaxID=2172099 RepID=A0A2S0VVU2_9ALTE|nr:gephyrin-like molybdotransferase Glp [Saccharobesus litoralis]AWB68336.1 molybdopterin molybdenumtransferase MoeA [Saccharobesus litoralis]